MKRSLGLMMRSGGRPLPLKPVAASTTSVQLFRFFCAFTGPHATPLLGTLASHELSAMSAKTSSAPARLSSSGAEPRHEARSTLLVSLRPPPAPEATSTDEP